MKRAKWLMFLVSVTLLFAVLPSPAYASVPSAPRKTVSFNGSVRAVAYAGDTIYLGGDFTAAYIDGKRSWRNHLAAVNATTGVLTDFAPALDGNVHALAVDGSQLYVGGYFRNVGDQRRRHIARFTSGALDPWRHSLSGVPRALAVSDGILYAGGSFNVVDDLARTNLAAWNLTTDTLTPFAPTVDGTVRSVTAGANRLYISGTFNNVNGDQARKLAAFDKVTGARDPAFAPKLSIIVYDVLLAHGRVYAAVGGQGGGVIAYDYNGNVEWRTTTDGDVQAITAVGNTVYAGGHFEGVCATGRTGTNGVCLDGERADRFKFFAVGGNGVLSKWNPWSDSVVGVWSLATNGTELSAGGAFLTFTNGTIQQRGFAQFRS